MAAANPAKNLQNQVTCSICSGYYNDPLMIIYCGHNFCRACITKNMSSYTNSNPSCPECRQILSGGNLIPNTRLANIVESFKELSPRLQELNPEKRRTCKHHKKPLSLFCRSDTVLVCPTCATSKAHRNHAVVSPEEAKASCEVKLFKHQENLKEEKNQILMVKSNEEKSCQEILKEIQAKKQETVCELQLQEQILEEQKQRHLNWLEDLERETEQKRSDYASLFDDEIDYMDSLISEIEKKRVQPADEFLEDIGSIFNRCEECKEEEFEILSIPNSADLKERVKQCTLQLSLETSSLKSTLMKFRENLLKSKWEKENLTLDPETAHPRYIVSEDLKSVSWGETHQNYSNSPKRFECARCMLGKEGFAAGKHYWKVAVQNVDNWAVGVARESVERDQELDFNPEEGIWAVAYNKGQYKGLTSPRTLLDPSNGPVFVQVCLDYDAGTVLFYNEENKAQLFSFLSLDFKGERVFPFFRIFDSSARLVLL